MLIGGVNIFITFIVLFFIFAFEIGQAVWIFLDSRNRGDKLGILWAMLALTPIFIPLLLPLPLIVYLLATRAFASKCYNCRTRVSNSFSSCPSCGVKLKEKCKTCGHALKKEWNYCPYCNDIITKEKFANEDNKEI